MKKKKGFTIPELLAVIVILGILVTISIASYNGISKSMKQKTLENKLKYYKEAAYEYATDTSVDNETITVGYLGELGYIDVEHPDAIRNERIDNPVTGGYLDCRVFNISRNLDDYDVTDTGKDDCLLAESQLKSSEINTKAYVFDGTNYTNLNEFNVNKGTLDDIISDNDSSNDLWNSIFGNTTSGIINSAFGSIEKFLEWLFPNANAKELDDSYTVYPWSNKEVYILFDFNNTTHSLTKNEVTYEVNGNTVTQTGNICTDISEGDCANVYKVDTLYIFNSYVKATVETEIGKISKKVYVRIDKESPSVSANYDTTVTKNNIKITFTGNDGAGSGIAGFYFGAKSNPSLNEFNDLDFNYINKNGTYYYASVDKAGNMSKVESIEVNSIDKEGPVGFVTPTSREDWSKDDFTFEFGCSTDTKSGCAKKLVYSIMNNNDGSYIVQNVTEGNSTAKYTVTTPTNTTLKSVTLTYTIYDNIGNSSTKSETIITNIDKTEKKKDDDPNPGEPEKVCKGWEGLACVIGGAGSGFLGGEIIGAVVPPIGSAVGAVVGAVAGAVAGILCWIFC